MIGISARGKSRSVADMMIKFDDSQDMKQQDDYYLTRDLTEKQLKAMDMVLNNTFPNKKSYATILNDVAKMRGKPNPNITLREAQIAPVLMSGFNPRFFIGDTPGLGKTVMSCACYAFYLKLCHHRKVEPKKVIVVTVSSHIIGFKKEWESFGIDLLPLTGGTANITRKLKKHNLDNYDGIIINWDGLKTDGFLKHYLQNHDLYDYAIFDETSKILNNTTQLYKNVDLIVNKYQKGIKHVILLNGSSFEKNLFDFYYQFSVLKPNLIPSKKFLEDRYIVRGGIPRIVQEFTSKDGVRTIEAVKRHTGNIESYRHQSELRDRLKYYYIARSKRDYSKDLPTHSYILHLVEPTSKQLSKLDERFVISQINSPTTSNPEEKMTFANSPKFEQIINFADETSKDRPILYVYNKEAQYAICEELQKLGYRVEVLNGDIRSSEERNRIVTDFNEGNLDMLVFNVINAINLPTSERILFYDIPMIPQVTNQIKGRIDRDNYTDNKFYDFFCYLDSPEMINIIKLACFREYHSSQFTGQYENIYGMLVAQITKHIGDVRMEKLQNAIENMYNTNQTFEEVTATLHSILQIK